MTWSSENIRSLRQRLGWSVAEMARHLGCRVETVKEFETGVQKPDPEVGHLMEHLLSCVESNAEKTLQQVRAECRLKDQDLSQVHQDDLDS